ncbi:MAG: Lpg1974 family pore-forming outer membrane protein [Planctomycetota bacterium]|nr:Lpg1974 family pore-forming outer membrane protein [Planctomycetota bacterium]
MLAGGIRYGRAGFSVGGPETFFEGAGPTVAIEAQREVGSRGLYLVGNARSSMLIGKIHNPADNLGFAFGGGSVAPTVDDEITVVLENQLGVGWTRELRRADLDLRLLWETQFWMNDTFADEFNGVGSNLAFSGLTVSTTLRY